MNHLIPRRFQPLVIAALGVGILLMAIGNLSGGDGEEGGVVAFLVTTVVALVATWLLWHYVFEPRGSGGAAAGSAGVVVGGLALLLAIFYWTGLVWALAPVAVALGVVGRDAVPAPAAARGAGEAGPASAEPSAASGPDPDDPRTRATAALVLGWLALLAATLLGVADVA